MIEQPTTRRCGSCGKPVGADDVLCPHCDALLAAYEAPPGATAGTSAAINPVDMSPEPPPLEVVKPPASPTPAVSANIPYESPTALALDALDAQKPRIDTGSIIFGLHESSPIAEALERTRIAAHLDPQEERPSDNTADANSAAQPIAEEQRRLFGMSVDPIHGPDRDQPPTTPPERPQPEPPRPLQESPPATVERVGAPIDADPHGEKKDIQQIDWQATVSGQTRPTPEQRAQPHDPPVRPASQNRTAQGRTSSGPATFIGIMIMVILVLRIISSGGFAGFLILPIIVIGLIWFMTTVAKVTGRKTTQMTKDKNRRKQEYLRRDRRLPR